MNDPKFNRKLQGYALLSPALPLVTNPPNLIKVKRVLILEPWYGDAFPAMGGTILRWLNAGVHVYVYSAYADLGTVPAGSLQKALPESLRNGWHELKQGTFFAPEGNTDQMSLTFLEIIRQLRPDGVFAPDSSLESECSIPAIKIGNAVRKAVLDSICDFYPAYVNGAPHTDTWDPSVLGFYRPQSPNSIVNITQQQQKKTELLNALSLSPAEKELVQLQDAYWGRKKGWRQSECFTCLAMLQRHCFNIPLNMRYLP